MNMHTAPPHPQQHVDERHLARERTDLATRVVRELSRQLRSINTSGSQNHASGRSPSPPAVHGVANIAGDKIRVDPNARHCALCDLSYNLQIARQHFEGKRHRQHLIRLVHLGEHAQLEQQALLARQAGLTLTEDLYGPFAHQPLQGLASSSPRQQTSPQQSVSLSLPATLLEELQHHADGGVCGVLLQELLGLFDAHRPAPHQHNTHAQHNHAQQFQTTQQGPSLQRHSHAPSEYSYGGSHSGGYHQNARAQSFSTQPAYESLTQERSYFHAAGEQLRGHGKPRY